MVQNTREEIVLQSFLASKDFDAIIDAWHATEGSGKYHIPSMITAVRASIPAELATWTHELVDVVVGTLRAHRSGKALSHWLFTSKAMEQGTHPTIANHHADTMIEMLNLATANGRLVDAAGLVEIGTGAGLDTQAFAGKGFSVTTFESHWFTAQVACVNFQRAGLLNVEVRNELWQPHTIMPDSTVAVWADPSRRSEGRRVRRSEDYQPSLIQVLGVTTSSTIKAVGIKVGPADEIDTGTPQCPINKQYIGFEGECKELVLWCRSNTTETNSNTKGVSRVTILDASHILGQTAAHLLQSANADETVSKDAVEAVHLEGMVLIEPHAAVVAAGMVEEAFATACAKPLDKLIAYGIAQQEPMPSDFYQRFRIQTALSGVRLKPLRKCLIELGWTNATEFKKRGWPGDPEELRKKMRLTPAKNNGGAGVVIITRVGNNHLTLLCQRM